MQAERVLGRDLALRDHLFEQLLAAGERLSEAVFLGPDQLRDLAAAFFELRVDRAHLPAHDVGQLVEERRLESKAPPELNRPADHPAQHVAAPFVRGRDAFGDEERRRPRVLDNDAVGLRRVFGRAVRHVRTLADPRQQRLERVDVEERIDSLQDHRRPLEAHSGVDVLTRQRRQGAVFGEIEFHEDQIPELEKPLALTAGSAGRPATAVLLAAVVVELAAGAAWTRIGRLPEVLGARESDDPFARHISLPTRDRDLVLAELQLWIAGEDRRPQTLRLELHPLGHELPGEVDRAVLEVIAERKVPEHLHEAEMPVRQTDVVEVVLLASGTHRLLGRSHTRRGRRLQAEEPALHRLHPRDDEKRRGVVGRRDHGCRRAAHMALLLEEGEKLLAKLGRGTHRE